MSNNPMEKGPEFTPLKKQEEKEKRTFEKFREKLTKNLQTTLESLSGDKEEEEIGLLRAGTFKRFSASPKNISTKLREEFSLLKREFWEAQEEYLRLPLPKNEVEQSMLWNTNRDFFIRGKIFDGFRSTGGRMMNKEQLNEWGGLDFEKRMGEEIIVDRRRDKKLSVLCEWSKELKDKFPDEEEKAFQIAQKVFKEMGGSEYREILDEMRKMQLKKEEVLLGEIKYGICRHRGPLFQVLAVEVDLDTVFRKGITESEHTLACHGWNEITLKNGEIIIVDTTNLSQRNFDKIDFKEFKDRGGFPRFGSNRLFHICYRDKSGRFIGGRFGARGLRKFLEEEVKI